jgi:hypothetical protein
LANISRTNLSYEVGGGSKCSLERGRETFTSLILHFKAPPIHPDVITGIKSSNQQQWRRRHLQAWRCRDCATSLARPVLRQRPLHENYPALVTSGSASRRGEITSRFAGGLGKPPGFEYNDPHKTESGAESAAANEDKSFGNWRNHDFQCASCCAAPAS